MAQLSTITIYFIIAIVRFGFKTVMFFKVLSRYIDVIMLFCFAVLWIPLSNFYIFFLFFYLVM